MQTNPTKVFSVPQTRRGKQIPRRLYAGDSPWRLKECAVQLAVEVACPLLGNGIRWGLPPQHRGVLWERVKSVRSVWRRRLRVPRVGAVGVMVLEMAVTQIRSTVQYCRWSPPARVYLLFNCSTSLSPSSFLLFSPSFLLALTHGSNLGSLCWTQRMCGWARGCISTLYISFLSSSV